MGPEAVGRELLEHDVVITGADLPVVRPFARELQRLRSCSFSRAEEGACLQAALQRSAGALLFHGRTRRSALLAQANPCDAVHHNLLLTRQVLQVVISSGTASFAFLSSDLALQTGTVLGAAFAAAEASVLEAGQRCPDLALAVVRVPSQLEPIQPAGLPLELTWRQEAAARATVAAITAITANSQQLVLSWPDPLGAPHELARQPLRQAVPLPQLPLIDWLQHISDPLQTYEHSTVARSLLDLWRQPNSAARSARSR